MSNPDLLPSTPWRKLLEDDFWGTPLSDSGSHGSYRPLCVLTFRLNYLLGGFHPWGYHLVNVLLHCLATVLMVRVARHVLPRTKSCVGPTLAGLVFAAHPVHTEAVAGIVGRADLAACNLYLLSFLAYTAHVKRRDSRCCEKYMCNHRRLVKEHEKLKQFRGLKYHQFVVNLQNNVTNCHWPRRFIRDFVRSESAVSCVGHLGTTVTRLCCWKNKCLEWITLGVCILLSVAAMLSKETGVTVLGVCVLYDFMHTPFMTKVSR